MIAVIVALEGEDVPDELLVHLSPMDWAHINLLGRYQFPVRGYFPAMGR